MLQNLAAWLAAHDCVLRCFSFRKVIGRPEQYRIAFFDRDAACTTGKPITIVLGQVMLYRPQLMRQIVLRAKVQLIGEPIPARNTPRDINRCGLTVNLMTANGTTNKGHRHWTFLPAATAPRRVLSVLLRRTIRTRERAPVPLEQS